MPALTQLETGFGFSIIDIAGVYCLICRYKQQSSANERRSWLRARSFHHRHA